MARSGQETDTGRRRGRGGRGSVAEDGPHPIDAIVGTRVRQRRTLLGMSQEKLGEAIGLTFQQVQKYERGTNRISASRLFELARVLEVAVSFFFDDIQDPASETEVARTQQAAEQPEEATGAGGRSTDPLARRETLELVRAYYRIGNPEARRGIIALTTALGQPSPEIADTIGASTRSS